MSLSRKDLLATLDRPVNAVSVPGVGDVDMREMSVDERDALNLSIFGDEGKRKWRPSEYAIALVAATVTDKAGERLLTASDVAAIGKGSKVRLEALFEAAQVVNGLGEQQAAVEKNSGATPNAASVSG